MKNDISKYFLVKKNDMNHDITEINNTQINASNEMNEANETFIEIYTDGACILNGKKNASSSFAFVIYVNDTIFGKDAKKITNELAFVSFDEKFKHTNQKAELLAIYYSLLYLKNNMQINTSKNLIRLYSDSEYSIKCLTEWCMNWSSKEWEVKKNTDILRKILQLIPIFNISFQHIKSHQTDTSNKHAIRNNLADKLAREQLISK